MSLELGNHWIGQFFTPYNICKCMAEMNIGDGTQEEISRKGYISVMDPACGAGATLIAAANTFKKYKINYQADVIFAAQDIDRIVGMMCYIQLSLLGCPGYVVIANSITNPLCGTGLIPAEKEGQEFWYTPFYFRTIWHRRRLLQSLKIRDVVELEKERAEVSQAFGKKIVKEGFFFFECEQEETVMAEQNLSNETLEGMHEEDKDCKKETEGTGQGNKTAFESTAETGENQGEGSKEPDGEVKNASEISLEAAMQKLEKEKDKAKDPVFADPIIKYLLGRIKEDMGLVADVLQEHKTWDKCLGYIRKQAQKVAKDGCAYVENETVYEWAEDYYHQDDKALEEKKRREEEERKKKQESRKVTKKQEAKTEKKEKNIAQNDDRKKQTKKNEIDGQFSLFDLV